jgi:hypothetical protein
VLPYVYTIAHITFIINNKPQLSITNMLRRYVSKYIRQPDVVDSLIKARDKVVSPTTQAGVVRQHSDPVRVEPQKMIVCLIDISAYR